jgi:hypothetical protein
MPVDHVIAVSHVTQKGLVVAGLPASAISVIYNGIDTDAWSLRQANEDLRTRWVRDSISQSSGMWGG